MKYVVRDSVMYLLLGLGKTSIKTSWRLIAKYGVLPTVLDKKRSLSSFLLVFSTFRRLPDSDSDEILMMSLDRLADEYKDMTCVIIPCEKYYKKFVSRNRAALESRFILRTPETAFDLSQSKKQRT